MEKEVLARMLDEGLSLEAIGREVGRHPSTVSYWLEKYGLEPAHRDRHAARGRLTREHLATLVAEGLTVAEMAKRVERSPTTVRHWLTFHGLSTRRAAAAKERRAAAPGPPELQLECGAHGRGRHVLRDGRYRCAACNVDAVTRRRREVKRMLVEEAGGACAVCGYDRWLGALQFHHLDPAEKRFSL